MANPKKSRKENVDSPLFVDETCIDCGTCYWMAPSIFHRDGGMSAVIKDPTEDDVHRSLQALFSCPTGSIGWQGDKQALKEARFSLPQLIEENVYHTGFHSERSYGATSYFIKSSAIGNVLVDSPRFSKDLVKKFQEMGGIDQYLLSHKDDVADTDKYHEVFPGPRSIHQDDKNSRSDHYENFWQGSEVIEISNDLICIPVPGHTRGSVVYLYKNKFLFTGDHLAHSHNLGHLYAFKTACWYDFGIQIKSMEKLLNYEFEWVLPGHGAPINLSKDDMRASLKKCISWMKA